VENKQKANKMRII